jgi:hypothetical protein
MIETIFNEKKGHYEIYKRGPLDRFVAPGADYKSS